MRKAPLREFFQTNQEGQDQATDKSGPRSASVVNRTKQGQVNQQGQNPIQNKVAYFISIGDLIDNGEHPQPACICQNDNENKEESEKDRQPLHGKKIETL